MVTDIDVSATLKKKLNEDFKIPHSRVCNPPFAFKALQAEDKIGTMLPCNVIVQQIADDEIEVAAIDPVASMKAIENPDISGIADQIQKKLNTVINNL